MRSIAIGAWGLRVDFLDTSYHEVQLATPLFFAGNWGHVPTVGGTLSSSGTARVQANLAIPVSSLTSTATYVLRCRTYTPDGVLRDEESFHCLVR